ncbi:MAG: hypothetical protein H6744_10755 [Deltaproteobacteria bacterium]|nr:hypothetical protein [Deltaproteobacteria bacterium]
MSAAGRAVARAASAVGLAGLVLGGCAAGFWGQGLGSDAPPAGQATPNAMVLVLGEAGWSVAAQRVAKDLTAAFPDGLEFDSALPAPSDGGASAVGVGFESARLHTGAVELGVDPLGVTLEVTATLEPMALTLELGGQSLCEVSVAFDGAALRGTVALTRTKLGRVHAGGLGAVSLEAPGALVDLSECPDIGLSAGGRFTGASDGYLTEAVLDAVALEAFNALAPTLADAVPEAMGLDIATDATVRFGDDGVGEGWVRARVRASEAEQDNWWQLAGARLHVPYAVALETKGHPCAPAPDRAVAPPTAIPTVDAEAALLLAPSIVEQAVWGLWRSGGLCGERIAHDLSWRADELAPGWPALDALPPETALTVRVWPDEAPELVLDTVGGEARAALSVPSWTLELYAELDGARVRLATITVGFEVEASFAVSADRAVWLVPEAVTVTAAGSAAGLLRAPAPEMAEGLAAPLADALLSARPIWWLPPFPLEPHDHVTLEGGYLVFASPPAGVSD